MVVTSYVATGITASFGTLTGELLDVKKSGEKADMVDVTKQSSVQWREFKAGLKDGGEWTLSFHFDPDAVVPAVGTSGTLIVTWPTGAVKKYCASALMSGRSESAALGQKMTADVTLKITGAPNWDYT